METCEWTNEKNLFFFLGYNNCKISRTKQITFTQRCFSNSQTLHESLQKGCLIAVLLTLLELRKMTARVMHKLRFALQRSCTRAAGNKPHEAICRDKQCLGRALQRCFNTTDLRDTSGACDL